MNLWGEAASCCQERDGAPRHGACFDLGKEVSCSLKAAEENGAGNPVSAKVLEAPQNFSP